jgi:hypothetical protein
MLRQPRMKIAASCSSRCAKLQLASMDGATCPLQPRDSQCFQCSVLVQFVATCKPDSPAGLQSLLLLRVLIRSSYERGPRRSITCQCSRRCRLTVAYLTSIWKMPWLGAVGESCWRSCSGSGERPSRCARWPVPAATYARVVVGGEHSSASPTPRSVLSPLPQIAVVRSRLMIRWVRIDHASSSSRSYVDGRFLNAHSLRDATS